MSKTMTPPVENALLQFLQRLWQLLPASYYGAVVRKRVIKLSCAIALMGQSSWIQGSEMEIRMQSEAGGAPFYCHMAIATLSGVNHRTCP